MSFARLLTAVVDPDDACGEDGGALCDWVYDHTDGNLDVAVAADRLIGRPLSVIVILAATWLLTRLARVVVRRSVRRVLAPPASVINVLGKTEVDEQKAAIDEARRKARAQAIAGAVASTVTVLIWSAALIWIASVLGADLAPLFAGAGIVGVALGFGSQSLVRDTINGIFMLAEDQYGIGDSVDLGAATGVVEKISLRTTVLRGFDGTVWHVPNGEVRRVGNRSQLWSVAVVDVVVPYNVDVVRAQAIMHEAAVAVCDAPANQADVLEPPEVLGVESLGTERVTLRLVVKTIPGRQWALQRALREAIVLAFDATGVAIPLTPLVGPVASDAAQPS